MHSFKFHKVPKRTLIEVGSLALYVLLLIVEINQTPGKRHLNWDYYWSDARSMSMLQALRDSLSHFTLPYRDMATNLSWDLGGDLFSFWNPFNAFILIFDEPTTLLLRCFFMLWIAATCLYFYFVRWQLPKPLAWMGAAAFVSMHLLTGFYQFHPLGSYVAGLPVLLLALDRWMGPEPRARTTLPFFFAGAYVTAVGEFNSFPAFYPLTVLYVLLAPASGGNARSSLKKRVPDVAFAIGLLAVSGAFYLVPVLRNMEFLKTSLQEYAKAGMDHLVFNPGIGEQYKNLTAVAIGHLRYPREAYGLNLYFSPVYLVAFIGGALLGKGPVRRLILCFMAIAAVIYYYPFVIYYPKFQGLPLLSSLQRGVLRYQLNLWPALAVIAGVFGFYFLRQYRFWIRVALFVVMLYVVRRWNVLGLETAIGPADLPSALRWKFLPKNNTDYFFYIDYALLAIYLLVPLPTKAWGKALVGLAILVHATYPLENGQGHMKASRLDWVWNGMKNRQALESQFLDDKRGDFRALAVVTQPKGERDDFKWVLDQEVARTLGIYLMPQYREIDSVAMGLFLNLAFKEDLGKFGISAIRSNSLAAANLEVLRALGIRYIYTTNSLIPWKGLKLLGSTPTEDIPKGYKQTSPDILWGGDLHVYELENAKPWFHAAFKVKDLTLPEQIKALWSGPLGAYTDTSEVWLEPDQGPALAPPEKGVKPEAKVARVRNIAQGFEFDWNSNAPGYLWMTMATHPGWKATVDGTKVSIRRAFASAIAVPVPAGQHTVRVYFIDWVARAGLLLTFLGLFGALYPWWKDRKRQAGAVA